jgi:hypothetical protein
MIKFKVNMLRVIGIYILILGSNTLYGQTVIQEDLLRQQVLQLQQDVDRIELNLGLAQTKFQRGIALATIGYSVTIAGGLMLGRSNDKLGQGLLVAGGATGITGTFLLVDSFKYLGRASGNQKNRQR